MFTALLSTSLSTRTSTGLGVSNLCYRVVAMHAYKSLPWNLELGNQWDTFSTALMYCNSYTVSYVAHGDVSREFLAPKLGEQCVEEPDDLILLFAQLGFLLQRLALRRPHGQHHRRRLVSPHQLELEEKAGAGHGGPPSRLSP